MVAFSMHLLRTVDGLKHVAIHPDGEHASGDRLLAFGPYCP